MKTTKLSLALMAILGVTNYSHLSTGVFAGTSPSEPTQTTIQQEQNIAIQYALYDGKFFIKINGLAFENVQEFLLNGEPITSTVLELVANQFITVLKENNAFTISFNLPKESNYGGMTFGIISGDNIYSSSIPSQVFEQDSLQVFDSVVSSIAKSNIEMETGSSQRRILKRNWTCHATFHVEGMASLSYTPPSWNMSGNIFSDREHECRNYIRNNLLRPEVWKKFGLPAKDQNTICLNGSGSIRVDYGFDERKKSWSFRHTVSSDCNCKKICPTNWWIDDGGRCASGVPSCGKVDLPDQFYSNGTNGIYIWQGGMYQWKQPALECLFK